MKKFSFYPVVNKAAPIYFFKKTDRITLLFYMNHIIQCQIDLREMRVKLENNG